MTGSSTGIIESFIQALGCSFDIKDMSSLHYFLGLQVSSSSAGLHIDQLKYAHDIIQKHGLLLNQPVSTPLAAKPILTITDGDLLDNPTVFRELIESLQYLTITRPDISFTVNTVVQFMSQPHTTHLIAAKRILRYIKGNLDHGLSFRPQQQLILLSAYLDVDTAACSTLCILRDVDWAGCPNSRRSTSGYLVYLGSNLIS